MTRPGNDITLVLRLVSLYRLEEAPIMSDMIEDDLRTVLRGL